jgi:peptidoglycan-N-acetylglucosamine deacetylase
MLNQGKINLFSIDLESFVSSQKYQKYSTSERKLIDNGKIISQVNNLLFLLKIYNQKITWFVTSEIFEWYPELIWRIINDGHEIGWHTHTHKILHKREDFERELDLADLFLKEIRPRGFRSPHMNCCQYMYELLKSSGFIYSSSQYASFLDFNVKGGIYEIPVNSYPLFEKYKTNEMTNFFGALRKFEIPIGSPFFMGLIYPGLIISIIKKNENIRGYNNLFIHNWQLFSEGRTAWRDRIIEAAFNPIFIPYLLPCRHTVRMILSKIEFMRFIEIDFIQNEIK